ncbi:MAG: single-stranded DNA-binding protein [Clostridiales bacterium]|nr:single-stranded DNA-binding protein [Clostridiales bacterium]
MQINNEVTLTGKLAAAPLLSHTMEDGSASYYRAEIIITRLSGKDDIIPVIVRDNLFDKEKSAAGTTVTVKGSYRSRRVYDEAGKSHTVLSVFAEEWIPETDPEKFYNNISLTGRVIKEPVYRKTPLGRDITDLLLVVNRPYGRTDYIPCILWGTNAKNAKEIKSGANVQLSGRIESREYDKKLENGTVEKRTAYEVSAAQFAVIE